MRVFLHTFLCVSPPCYHPPGTYLKVSYCTKYPSLLYTPSVTWVGIPNVPFSPFGVAINPYEEGDKKVTVEYTRPISPRFVKYIPTAGCQPTPGDNKSEI